MKANAPYEELRFPPYDDLEKARAYLRGKKARHRGEPVAEDLLSKRKRRAWLRGYLLSTEFMADRTLQRPGRAGHTGAGIGSR
jgi:hypothetical protein